MVWMSLGHAWTWKVLQPPWSRKCSFCSCCGNRDGQYKPKQNENHRKHCFAAWHTIHYVTQCSECCNFPYSCSRVVLIVCTDKTWQHFQLDDKLWYVDVLVVHLQHTRKTIICQGGLSCRCIWWDLLQSSSHRHTPSLLESVLEFTANNIWNLKILLAEELWAVKGVSCFISSQEVRVFSDMSKGYWVFTVSHQARIKWIKCNIISLSFNILECKLEWWYGFLQGGIFCLLVQWELLSGWEMKWETFRPKNVLNFCMELRYHTAFIAYSLFPCPKLLPFVTAIFKDNYRRCQIARVYRTPRVHRLIWA